MLHPIVARLPAAETVDRVVAPPYDALTPEERFRHAQKNPENFLSVILSPEDYPAPSPTAEELGHRAREALARITASGAYGPQRHPAFYVYGMTDDHHQQLGVVGALPAGDAGQVLGHEKVIPERVAALARFYRATGLNTSPVALGFRPLPSLTDALHRIAAGEPLVEHRSDDGAVHRIWEAGDPAEMAEVVAQVDRWYITDGHHRMAAALAGEDDARVLVVGFPADELRILGYHRVVNAQPPPGFLAEVARSWRVEPWGRRTEVDMATGHGVAGMVIGGEWYRLVREGSRPDDPVARLDVALIHDEIIEPLLGVPADDATRISYVVGDDPGRRLESVCPIECVGFLLAPPNVEEVMDVADAGRSMPPKSTWFTPKARSGLLLVER